MHINLDGESRLITGTTWVSQGLFNGKKCDYLNIIIKKAEFPCPVYVATYNIPIPQILKALKEGA